jgi:hypothetical protein
MAKNMIRKSLAIASASALAGAALVAAPAQAASAIILDSNGESGKFGAVVADTFVLKANGNADFLAGNATQLRVEVVNTTGVAASGFAINGTALDSDNDIVADGVANSIELFGGGQTADSIGAAAGDKAVFGLGVETANQNGGGDLGGASAMTSPFTFSFSAAAEGTFAVTVFADSDNDGVRDADELASPTRTVSFIPLSKVAASITVTAPVEADETMSGSFTLTGIDGSQVAVTDLGVFIESATDATIGADNAGAANASLVVPGAAGAAGAGKVTYNATDDKFEFSTAALDTQNTGLADALAKGVTLKVHVLHDAVGGGAPAAGDTVENTSLVVAARASGSLVADTVDGDTVQSITAAANAASTVTTNAAFGVSATVKDTATPAAAIAGATVTAKVTTNAGLDADETLTINGTTYNADAKLPGATGVARLSLVSDANGQVVVNIDPAGLVATNTVTVDFYYENRTAQIVMTLADSVFQAHLVNAVGTATTVDGTAVQLEWIVRDQHGAAPANGKYNMYSDFVSSDQATTNATAATESYAAVVNGSATLTVLDNGTGAGTNVYDFYLGLIAPGGGYTSSTQFADAFPIQVAASALQTPATITEATANLAAGVYTETLGAAIATADSDLNLESQVNYDSRTSLIGAPSVTAAANNGVVISGTVTDASGVVIDNQLVTISGPAGMVFRQTIAQVDGDGAGADANAVVAAQTVYGVGSISVYTDGSGAYSVNAFSNNAGKQTVTVTAGAVSQTVVLDSFAAAADDTGATLTLNTPASILPGRTLVITGSLVDKFGNPVTADGTNEDFVLTYSGPGYKNVAPTEISADGTFSWSILLGSNDSGTATVTAAYDLDEDGDYTDTGDLVVTKTIIIGTAPADTKVNAGSFKGYVAIYAKGHEGKRLSAKVGKDWVVVPALASNFVRVVEYTGAGYTIAVRIYIDRVLVDTITVITK